MWRLLRKEAKLKSLFHVLSKPIEEYLSSNDNLIAPASTHAMLCLNQKNSILIVTTSTRAATELADELISLVGIDQVVNFPAWETLPHERLSPKSDTVTARFKALNRISNNQSKYIVCSIRALLQPIIANDLKKSIIRIEKNLEIRMSDLIEQLSRFGYQRSDLVEKRGDFAVRGGILDLFPPDQEHPIRIDFFADEIDELTYFAISDQRSLDPISSEVVIYPCRELIIDEGVKSRAKALGEKFPQINELTQKLSEGITFEGMESLAAGVVSDFKSILDYLPNGCQIWLIDEPRIKTRSVDLISTNQEFLEAAWSNLAWSDQVNLQVPIDLSEELGRGGFYEMADIYSQAKKSKFTIRNLNLYAATPEDLPLDFLAEIENYGNKYEVAVAEIAEWHKEGYQVVFSAAANGTLKRFSELLNAANISNQILKSNQSSKDGLVNLVQSDLKHGFISDEFKLVVVTDKDISGQRSSDKDLARMPSRRKKSIDPLQ